MCPTRVYRRGQLVAVGGAPRFLPPIVQSILVCDAPLPTTKPKRGRSAGPSNAGSVFTNDRGVNFRIVDTLTPPRDWVGQEVLMHWFSATYAQVLDWLRRGFLDGAVLANSRIERYRIVDLAAIRVEVPKKAKS